MKSLNFEYLRAKRPVLADLAAFAEQYAHSDPAGSLIKLRGFIEHAVVAIYRGLGLREPLTDNLNDLMNAQHFEAAIPETIHCRLNAIRLAGNHAAHPRRAIESTTALERLFQAFEVGQWIHLRIDNGKRSDFPVYAVPPREQGSATRVAEVLDKLKEAERKYDEVLAKLEQERQHAVVVQEAAAQTAEELSRLKAEGQKVATILQFNEETTRRRLIDTMLIAAGWDVGANGKNTEQVRQEVKVFSMPNKSGDGYADYVLMGDDGKPLAVIEAKRTSKDALVGQEQARTYATCLEKETGQRPVIFFTNGKDIYIWDDAGDDHPRKIHGLYSKDSLEYLIHQRTNKKALVSIKPDHDIADRLYQLEAVRRVCESFDNKARKALLVQATGTGKTRVAVSMCDVLIRAGWAKRILFLCDRRELLKQANKAFKDFIPNEPRVTLDATTSDDRGKRIYLATYPAMMKCYEDFDVGFFDLIVADESHRSIYKKYRSLFMYFDALAVGLTATPVKFIERNTYEIFGCRDRDPTSHFSFEEAIQSTPPYLVPFRVLTLSSELREKGIRYSQLSDEQKAELESQDNDAENVDYSASDLDRIVFNKDTTRHVWRSLMEQGIREATQSRIGKTIVFARNHDHAVHLAKVFAEMYPQYGSTFCRVIDNQEPYAEQLIDDFKEKNSNLTIAISVDMLDTGIDVPEVVNLVFAKTVRSYVKFWQMIGRGTRLCKDLFGKGQHKTEFLIFDHGSNFWYFEQAYTEKEPSVQKSLLQQLFETRVAIAAAAVEKMDQTVLLSTVELIQQDVRDLIDTGTLEVKDRWRELEMLAERPRLEEFAPATKSDLLSIAAPLMQWRNVRGNEDAYEFDLLVARLELEVLQGGAKAPGALDLKAGVEEQVELLLKEQNPVKAKAESIGKVRSKQFWDEVAVDKLESLRVDLRGIMKYRKEAKTTRVAPQTLDITDTNQTATHHIPKLEGLELVEYRQRVESVLKAHFTENPVLQRIRAGQSVKEEELEALVRLVLEVDDKANVLYLTGHNPESRKSLLTVFRGLVGLDADAVEAAFMAFVKHHPSLSAQQLRFLQVLKNYIAQNGGIELERLYERPFTDIHAEGIEGVFKDSAEMDEIWAILSAFEPKKAASQPPPPASQRAS